MILKDRRIDPPIYDCNDANEAEILILDDYTDAPFVKTAFEVKRLASKLSDSGARL